MFFSVSTFFKIKIAVSIPFRKLTEAAIKRYSAKYIGFQFDKLCKTMHSFSNIRQYSGNLSTLLLGWYEVATSGNVKSTCVTTLCMSMLKFKSLKNIKSTLSNSTLILATLDNVETLLLNSTSSFTTLINVETMLWIWSKKLFLSYKKKMTHLINKTCFWLWSIKKKGKHGAYKWLQLDSNPNLYLNIQSMEHTTSK